MLTSEPPDECWHWYCAERPAEFWYWYWHWQNHPTSPPLSGRMLMLVLVLVLAPPPTAHRPPSTVHRRRGGEGRQGRAYQWPDATTAAELANDTVHCTTAADPTNDTGTIAHHHRR